MQQHNNEIFYKSILKKRDAALEKLKDKAGVFLLGGGTALSVFYFRHRESFDLDLFAKEQDFLPDEIIKIISDLFSLLNIADDPRKLTQFSKPKDKIIYARNNLPVLENLACHEEDLKYLKIDFICDYYRDLVPNEKIVNGVKIMSLENIYLRKIYTVFGTLETKDNIGRTRFVGGRQEAKDFFDLYYLSNTFVPLSKFMKEYCDLDEKQSAILWQRSYNRLEMEAALREIRTKQKIDYRQMVSHFDSEVEQIIRSLI